MNRRALTNLMPPLHVSAAMAFTNQDALLAVIDNAMAERRKADVDDWLAIAHEYAQNVLTTPPGALINNLALDIMELGAALKRNRRHQARKDLLRASSEVAVYMAMELGDLGYLGHTYHSFATATGAADHSGDRSLGTWIRARRAARALWEEYAWTSVMRLVDEAVEHSEGVPGPGLATALETRVKLLAAQQNAEAAESGLNELRRVFAALPDEVTEDQISARGWPEHNLRFTEAFVYSHLGDTKRAHTAIDQALELCPEEKAGGRANLQLLRAITLVHEREVLEGLMLAVTTCRFVPSTAARRRLVAELFGILPDAEACTHPAVDELEVLTAPHYQDILDERFVAETLEAVTRLDPSLFLPDTTDS